MYDDPRLKPRLTGDITAERRGGRTVALLPVNGRVVPLVTPGDLPPNGAPQSIPATTAAARFMLGILLASDLRQLLERPLSDEDLW